MRPILCLLAFLVVLHAGAAEFKVGVATRDITPTAEMPMWGYGARHDLPGSAGTERLLAKVILIEVGEEKLALVGLDLGRSPMQHSMETIKAAVLEQAKVNHVMLVGSHTHHGPVLELLDQEGKGKGKFDAAVAYVAQLETLLTEAIVEAAGKVVPAKMGYASAETDLNRNRHKKTDPKPRDPELAVIRFDDMEGKPLAIAVNFAAHAVTKSIMERQWSSDWPGAMYRTVEAELGGACVFFQGSAGDMSPNQNEERKGTEGFGNAVGARVIELAQGIHTAVPATPGIESRQEEFTFATRIKLHDPIVQGMFKQAFFPELLAMLDEMPDDKIHPQLVTTILNNELAIVGGSGEFFCEHSNRLKRDSKAKETFFFGYCNGHHMYFPTREAIELGGYGADQTVSWVEPGAGEQMIDKALANITEMMAN
jgi:neutral ceramidase